MRMTRGNQPAFPPATLEICVFYLFVFGFGVWEAMFQNEPRGRVTDFASDLWDHTSYEATLRHAISFFPSLLQKAGKKMVLHQKRRRVFVTLSARADG